MVSYLHGDHLSSASLTTDASGNKYGELRYKPYGETRYTWGNTPTDHRFTDQTEMASIGLYDYGARFYSSYLNQWLSPDSIVPQSGDPQTLNRYNYARSNPIKYVDPSGHFFIVPAVALILVVAGGGFIADWSFQVSDNIYKKGQSFWEAVGHENLDEQRMVTTGAEAGAAAALVVTAGPEVAVALGGSLTAAGMANEMPAVTRVGQQVWGAGQNAQAQLWYSPEVLKDVAAAARAQADASQAAQPSYPRGGASAAYNNGIMGVGVSDRNPQLNPVVQEAYSRVPPTLRPDYWGKCAEGGSASSLLNQGGSARGALITSIRARPPGDPAHGTPLLPCPACQRMIDDLGMTWFAK